MFCPTCDAAYPNTQSRCSQCQGWLRPDPPEPTLIGLLSEYDACVPGAEPVPCLPEEYPVFQAVLGAEGLVEDQTSLQRLGIRDVELLQGLQPDTLRSLLVRNRTPGRLGPERRGILRVSRAGFNPARTQALVTTAHSRGGRAGIASLVLLEPAGSAWQVRSSQLLWVS